MLRKVEVWNDDSKPYSEEFKGDQIVIPAKSCIVMEDSEASLFMGQFPGLKRDGQGRDITVKMLRKVYITGDNKPEEKSVCMACSAEFKTPSELEMHSKTHEAARIKEEVHANTASSKFFS